MWFRAAEVDRTGAFPRADIDALAGAGVLGLLSTAEVGGAGREPGTRGIRRAG